MTQFITHSSQQPNSAPKRLIHNSSGLNEVAAIRRGEEPQGPTNDVQKIYNTAVGRTFTTVTSFHSIANVGAQ